MRRSTQTLIGVMALAMLVGGIGSWFSLFGDKQAKALNYQNTVTPTFTSNSGCSLVVKNSGATVLSGTDSTATYSEANAAVGSTKTLGGTTFNITCNGSGTTWSVTAMGYTGDTAGGTTLTGTAGTIATNANESGATSGWRMQVTGTGAQNRTDYGVIPGSSGVVVATGTASSTLTANYKVYIGTGQASGQYTGKVKYTFANLVK